MLLDYLQLLLGIGFLVYSGDWLVRGGVSIAAKYKISPLVVGVTIISFGTSAPELVVSVNAAISGHPAISIGNVVGSNISNIALVLGVTVLLISIPVRRKTISFDWQVMFFATILFFLFSLNEKLELWEGIVFLIFLIAYNYYSIASSRKEMKKKMEKNTAAFSPLLSLLIIVFSIFGLMVGSHFLIKSASHIAVSWGVSERVISISVIALGTSLPELATAVMAARRKELDISVGNLIGSNIFNIFGILGVTAIVREIPVDSLIIAFDWYWMVGICVLLFVFMMPPNRSKIQWWKGLIFIMLYVIYYLIIFMNPS